MKIILNFEIQIVTKIRHSKIKICNFNVGFWNCCIRISGDTKKDELMIVPKEKNFTERSV